MILRWDCGRGFYFVWGLPLTNLPKLSRKPSRADQPLHFLSGSAQHRPEGYLKEHTPPACTPAQWKAKKCTQLFEEKLFSGRTVQF
eukprot:2297434-Amphidinium_carterae.1